MNTMHSRIFSSLFALSRLASAAAVLSAVACSAHADIPNITVTEPNVTFSAMELPDLPEVPEGIDPQEYLDDYLEENDLSGELTTRFDHPGDMDLPDFMKAELSVTAVRLRAQQGVDSLSFVKRIEVMLASDAPDAPPPLRLAQYERRGDVESSVPVINVDPDETANVLDHWKTGAAYYEILLEGDGMPLEEWSVEVTVEFSGSLDVSP